MTQDRVGMESDQRDQRDLMFISPFLGNDFYIPPFVITGKNKKIEKKEEEEKKRKK